MSAASGLQWKPAVRQTSDIWSGRTAATGAKRKLATLTIPAFTSAKTSWDGSSQAVASFCIEITGRFTIHAPVTPPSGVQFCPVIKWTDDSGALRRLKLFEGVGEILPYPVYVGESILAPAAIEIWNVQNYNPATMSTDWSLQFGLLEDQTDVTDQTGSIYVVDSCIASFPYFNYGMLDTLMYTCRCV